MLHIWESVLKRSKDEIYAMSYKRSLTRNFRVTFKLPSQIEAAEIFPEPVFDYPRVNAEDPSKTDAITCRFVGYSNVKPAEIGQLTRITAVTNDFAVEPEQITRWLSKFQSVSSNYEFERNSIGIRSDVLETEIVLQKHIPEYLPVAGRKVQISYPGIPRACNNCYQLGHMRRNCKASKREWIERVAEMRSTGEFEDELFGGWIAILDQRT